MRRVIVSRGMQCDMVTKFKTEGKWSMYYPVSLCGQLVLIVLSNYLDGGLYICEWDMSQFVGCVLTLIGM